MNLELYRRHSLADRTIGDIYIEGHWECFSLEDLDRHLEDYLTFPEVKIPGQTAIPRGRYEITIDMSARFKCLMPHLLNVPLFEGVRIHTGNSPADVAGCIICGKAVNWDTHVLLHSRLAFGELFQKINHGLNMGKVWIDIT